MVQLRGFDAAHYRRTEGYARQIDQLCRTASNEYAALAGTLFQPDLSKPFSFDDYPQTKKQAALITSGLARKIQSVVVTGTAREWQAACDKNDAFIASIIRTSRLTPEEAAQYQVRNLEALQSFQQRKIEGLGLSQRVWRYVGDIKDTIELGIDVGLGEGRSAQQLSRDLRQCLQEPNKLFRRVRDKYGNLQLSKAARLYHPGQGVYRSSAKNAMRLARTEVNMAYRTAEYLRWQQLDFVVGIRIWLSNNHTILDSKGNPQPLIDICDDLAGDYPKTFLFRGWHPQCRCVVTPILSDYDEYNRERGNRLKAIVRGEAYKSMPSRRTVTAMPEKFTRYIESIAERSKGWKSQPYYIRDNFNGGTIGGGLKAGVAASLKGATETKGKPAVKNNSQPCTEFDTTIARLKKYAYTFGLDVSKLDALRLAGEREPLRIEVERLEALEDERWNLWVEATKAAFTPVKEMQKHGFKQLETKFLQLINQYSKATPAQYYADCITKLQEIQTQAQAELAKAIADAAKPTKITTIEDIEKANNITYREVSEHTATPTEAKIIERLGGRDKTKGSCSSLAFAYAANKGGLDVLDFRGGQSCEKFSRIFTIMKIVGDLGGKVMVHTNDFTKATELLKEVQPGKEYYFTCGKHAAIVRKTDAGFEYLELQSTNDAKAAYHNGWHALTRKELKWRFGAQTRHTIAKKKIETAGVIIEVSQLYGDSGYKKLMGYINTEASAQMKGQGGSIK